MLPADSRKWGTCDAICAERAIVQQLDLPGHPAHGLVARTSMIGALRPQPSPEVMFHQFAIAHALFPENFMQVVGVAPASAANPGPVLLSRPVELDALSRRVLSVFYDGVNTVDSFVSKQRNPDYREHAARVRAIAKHVAKRMGAAGIHVGTNPMNVFFDAHGIPVFFDLKNIASGKLSKHKNKLVKGSARFLLNHPAEQAKQGFP